MPEWICFDCGGRSYGWGGRYGQPCPHCGGKLVSTDEVTIIEKEDDHEATDGRAEEEDTTAV